MSQDGADLRHVETWLFDLDNTLYPAECEFMSLIEGRMTEFVARETGLPKPEALALQKKYLHEHGTTLAGLMALHGVDPHAFIDEVHDVSMDRLIPDPQLRAGLQRLPGRRVVFTNGGARHAERLLDRLEIADLIEGVFSIETANFLPKPHADTYAAVVLAHGLTAATTAFFEDSERNLAPAATLGMTTVLVGAKAKTSTAPFVQHRTVELPPFLLTALVGKDQ
jgi:putative hydrolase of the HAD superfamily